MCNGINYHLFKLSTEIRLRYVLLQVKFGSMLCICVYELWLSAVAVMSLHISFLVKLDQHPPKAYFQAEIIHNSCWVFWGLFWSA